MTDKKKFPQIIGEHSVPLFLDQEDRPPVIWVNDFDEESARNFFDLFTCFLSDDMVENIIVYIDSFGGNVDSLAAMAELIDSSPKTVITVGLGKTFSAGAMLLALGTPGNRWIAPHSRVMLHRLQLTTPGEASADTIAQIAGEILRMNDVWLRKIVERSKMKWVEFNKKLNDQGGQWYMDAKTAVSYGFADYIGLPIIRENRQWIIDIK